MKEFFESAFFIAAATILWGKIGLTILSIAAIIILCNHIRRIISRAILLKGIPHVA